MCKTCKKEMKQAFEYQEAGYTIGIEEWEGHCFCFIVKQNGEVVLI